MENEAAVPLAADEASEPLSDNKIFVESILRDSRLNKKVLLDCGITLGYADVGPENGFPVLMFMGVDSHRYLIKMFEGNANAHQLRLISIDRPGRGLTDNVNISECRISMWPGIIEDFTRKLQIQRFALVGHSLGAVYALYTGHLLKQSVVGIYLVAPWTSLNLAGTSLFFRGARLLPTMVVKGCIELSQALVRRLASSLSSSYILETISKSCSEAERKTLLQRETRDIFEAIKMSRARGERSDGIVLDMLAAIENTHQFPFEYKDIVEAVHVYQGDADTLVDLKTVRHMCSFFEKCEIQVKQKGTHALLMDEEVVTDLFRTISAKFQTDAT